MLEDMFTYGMRCYRNALAIERIRCLRTNHQRWDKVARDCLWIQTVRISHRYTCLPDDDSGRWTEVNRSFSAFSDANFFRESTSTRKKVGGRRYGPKSSRIKIRMVIAVICSKQRTPAWKSSYWKTNKVSTSTCFLLLPSAWWTHNNIVTKSIACGCIKI